jgi:peptidylamidoglycolate lyase
MKPQAYWLSAMLLGATAGWPAATSQTGLAPVASQEKGGDDLTGPYDAVPNWVKGDPVVKGRLIYPVSVFPQNADRIFILSIGNSPVPPKGTPWPYGNFSERTPGAKATPQLFVVNRAGKVIEDWSQWSDLLISPHFVRINPYDAEQHVWVLDRDSASKGGQIFEFTNDGKKLVKSLGTKGEQGSDDRHFGQETDIAWLPDGTFYVSDGYVNTRIVKFDKTGKFLKEWGTKGSGPGQFNLVHSVAVDARGRVYVADRTNCRVQVFDDNGKYLDQWPDISSPTRIMITQDQFAWVSDGGTGGCGGASRLLKYDLAGKLLTYWGTGARPGREGAPIPGMIGPHDFSVDSEGNVYVASSQTNEVNKFVPKKNADRGRLIGQPFKAGK